MPRHPSQKEGESIKAAVLWNTWFTVNNGDNVNSILIRDFNGPIRGRQWIKQQRNDEKSKSTQLPISREQIVFSKTATMGRSGSTNASTGTRPSKKIEPNLNLANQICKNMIIASYKDGVALQKTITIVKNTTKGKLRSLDSPLQRKTYFAICRGKRITLH